MIRVDLPFAPPLDPSNLFGHLVATGVPGVEEWRDGRYRAVARLASGPVIIEVGLPVGSAVQARLHLADAADEPEAVALVRRALDLDLDAPAMVATLSEDPVLAPLVAAAPGRRRPGTLDPESMVLRAVLGQQVSTAAARTHAARLVAAFGTPIEDPAGDLTRAFPSAGVLAADPQAVAATLRLPESRKRTFAAVVAALATGAVDLGAPAEEVRAALLALPGVGPWTADTVLMRALGAADVLLPTDLGVVRAARRLGLPDRPRGLEEHARRWSPYRTHAVQYLWATGVHPVNTLPPG
ncbi:DNA-3-methyladenine glycosylase family protein [uncultured Amnibacterium sp.]|uniref:DNA-3-methyladenine glycosylase family protein n=1 Tax=uncultured Amnibacterium sp. TaxID=1631851 RepID=UPI0035CA88CD